jgi:uncharacterized metal-binding protein YceD (DUF177 family)
MMSRRPPKKSPVGTIPVETPEFSRPFLVERALEAPATMEIVADEDERRALALAMGLPAIGSLTAKTTIVAGRGGRFEVTGFVHARVTQICVVSLEPFESDLREPIEASFIELEEAPSRPGRRQERDREVQEIDEEEPPEPIVDGRIDLGAVAAEFLALGLDPYPRKPGVEFELGDERAGREASDSPFAALARLVKPEPPKDA